MGFLNTAFDLESVTERMGLDDGDGAGNDVWQGRILRWCNRRTGIVMVRSVG
jgi:hypothetical protein